MKKKTVLTLSFLLSVFVLPLSTAHAEETPASPALCGMTLGTPEVLLTVSMGCYLHLDCIDEQQCWTNCPEALSASCTLSGCQYTMPGGGGTGSGGACPQQRDCIDDSQCVYGSLQGTCSGDTCHC